MLSLNDPPSHSEHPISLIFLNHTYMLLGPASVVQVKLTLSPLLWVAFIGNVDTIPSGETVRKLGISKFILIKYLQLTYQQQ